jgi:hypothetical protein
MASVNEQANYTTACQSEARKIERSTLDRICNRSRMVLVYN